MPATPTPSILAAIRSRIAAAHRLPEAEAMRPLLDEAAFTPDALAATQRRATGLAEGIRGARTKAGGVDALMLEFSLDSNEGVALMCLAEALLRIPDAPTRDRLIRDKIGRGDWRTHVGRSPSLFVNAAAWGLLVTGTLVDSRSDRALERSVMSMLRKGGEPLIRKGVDLAMRMLGRQFVTGRTIDEALVNARDREARGYRFAFDVLGEAALTGADAARYFAAYEHAIHAIGRAAANAGAQAGPGISIKLSALHPRYTRLQRQRVLSELLPRVATLAALAREYRIGFNIDAEEAGRLELSLDIFEALAGDPALADWDGLGFVVQAYQRRARDVIDWLIALARQKQRRLMVRLVKGAYWDTEIKRAQVDGLADYPVFTRKVHTDVSYLACARAMLAAPDALYPQFASHNAFTIAAIHTLAGNAKYEFQCLHGMGESVYDQIVGAGPLHRPCRIYAPVGSHETLLAYLVRRLLENGANSSFVNRIVDPSVDIADLVHDHVARAKTTGGTPHPRIPLPMDLFADRRNSRGMDFSDEAVLDTLATAVHAPQSVHDVRPMLAVSLPSATRAAMTIRNPADHADIVGTVMAADSADVAAAVAAAVASPWLSVPADVRATLLERAADMLEDEAIAFMVLLVREAGKSLPNAAGEVRETVDFCRYYAAQARRELTATTPRGPLVCIAPWNFPLAIFAGQMVAALAAGNPVLAKPAEQTPCIAATMVALLHRAGIPVDALQLLPGRGETVGAALVADSRIAGVLFTGSTAVAQTINRTLALRDDEPLLIAETGGINAMIVDSSALPEQVVQDAITSAFDSAGQRCSALRLLCVQEDVAATILPMLRGAMAELTVGDPRKLATDVGPVIDDEARAALENHVARLRAAGAVIEQLALPPATGTGTFFPPTLIELADPAQLTHEVFGPVLHVLRFREDALASLLDAINAPGYGLTHGIQTRIDETVEFIGARIRAGNVYVNRNIVGAVVGVQPFGGEGLSGTGPKAGGPHYLRRLVRAAETIAPDALHAPITLPGPTGESNTLVMQPRGRVACIAGSESALTVQVRTAHAFGNMVLLTASPAAQRIAQGLTGGFEIVADPIAAAPDVVLFDGTAMEARALRRRLAAMEGALIPLLLVRDGTYDTARLVSERTLTINTTASGGNASLLSLTEAVA